MITYKDAVEEMDNAEQVIKKETNPLYKVIVKLLVVAIKIGLNVRSNTKLIMDAMGIKPIEATKDGKKETSNG